MLIKEKQAFLNVQNSEVFENPDEKESYYKISKNTNVIDDIDNEIDFQEGFIRKNTVFANRNEDVEKKKENNGNSIYRINGIEFLPEGFLELDPLLYKDEYEFENILHEKIFLEQQRKLKALRRKQYSQKNQKKMREVTIYVLDEHKDKIIYFLENWYMKHKRKMSSKEIKYVADLLKCEHKTMKDLQDLFLYKKKILDTKKLRNYLMENGRFVNNKIMVPEGLRKYFINKKNLKDQGIVFSGNKKVFKRPFSSQNNIRKNNKYKNHFTERVFGKDSNVNNSNFEMTKDLSENGLNKTAPIFDNKKKVNVKNNTGNLGNNFGKNEKEKNLKIYFDSEVNKILDNLENGSRKMSNKEIKQIIKKKKKKSKRFKHSSNHFNKKPKLNRVLIQDIVNDMENSRQLEDSKMAERLIKSSKKNKKQKNPRFSSPLAKKRDKSITKKKTTTPNKKKTPAKKASIRKSSLFTKNQLQEKIIKNKPPQRVTIITKSKTQTLIIQKLPPILHYNNNYFQQIQDKTENNKRTVTIITKNDQDQIISKKVLEKSQITDTYTNQLIPDTDRKKSYLLTKNSKNEVVSITPIRPLTNNLQQAENGNLSEISNLRGTIVNREKNLSTSFVLQPIYVLDHYYQQLVNEGFEENGDRFLSVVTKNEEGIVLAEDKIENFENAKSYFSIIGGEKINEKGEKTLILETRNNKGDTIASHKIKNSIIGAEKNIFKTKNEDFKKNRIFTEKKKGKIVRTCSIPAVLCGKEFFKQELEEEMNKGGKKGRCVTIVTKNQFGEILGRDKVREDLIGNRYVSEIVNDCNGIGDGFDRKITILTKNDLGEVVCARIVSPTVNNVLGENFFDESAIGRKSVRFSRKRGRSTLNTFAIRPTIIGEEYYQQIINENIYQDGERKVTLITKNKNGEKVSSIEIPEKDFKGKEFETKIIKENSEEIIIITKNEKQEIIAEQKIRPTIFNVIGENYFDDEQDKKELEKLVSLVKNRKSVLFKKKKGKSIINSIAIRPTFLGSQYYQQIIEEVLEEGTPKRVTITTKTKDNKIISKYEIPNKKLKHYNGKEFETKVVPLEDDFLSILTKNEKGEIIADQKLRPTIFNVIGEDYFENFNDIIDKRASVMNIQSRKGTVVNSHILRPTKIGENYYQQVIQEIINNEDNRKSVFLIAKKNDGTLVAVDELSPKIVISSDLHTEVEQKDDKNVLVVKDASGKKIGEQILEEKENEIEEDLKERNTSISRPSILSSLTRKSIKPRNSLRSSLKPRSFLNKINKKKKSVRFTPDSFQKRIISHSLRPTIIGNRYYHQIVEEFIDEENKRKVTIITKNDKDQIIDKKTLNTDLTGNNYYSELVKDIIDSEGNRRITIEVKNDRGKTLSSLRLRPTINEVIGENYFDDEKESEIKKQNKISFVEKYKGSLKINKLRPTLVGNRLYSFYFVEKTDDAGNRKLTFVCKDRDEITVFEQNVNPKLASKKYELKVEDGDFIKDERVATVVVYDDKQKVILRKKMKSECAIDLKEWNIDDFFNIFDDEGNVESTLSIKKKKNTVLRSHSLRPTLIGSEYFTQIVNEVIENDFKKISVVTKKENGDVVSVKNVSNSFIGSHYRNSVINRISKNGERIFVLETTNDKGENVLSQVCKPSVNLDSTGNIVDEVLEEILDAEGNKSFSVLDHRKTGDYLISQDFILNEDITEEIEEKKKNNPNKNEYFENLVKNYQFQRDPRSATIVKNIFENKKKSNSTVGKLNFQKKNKNLKNSLKNSTLKQSKILEEIPQDLLNQEINDINHSFCDPKNLENEDALLEKSERLRGYIEDYIDTLKESKKNEEEEKLSKKDQEEKLRDLISEVFEKEKEKLSDSIVDRIDLKMKGREKRDSSGEMMDEFYDFCKDILPKDRVYKESIILVSLFYYFLQKKGLIKK